MTAKIKFQKLKFKRNLIYSAPNTATDSYVHTCLQAELRAAAGSAPDHGNKENIAKKQLR